jgi:hypothetical protein
LFVCCVVVALFRLWVCVLRASLASCFLGVVCGDLCPCWPYSSLAVLTWLKRQLLPLSHPLPKKKWHVAGRRRLPLDPVEGVEAESEGEAVGEEAVVPPKRLRGSAASAELLLALQRK